MTGWAETDWQDRAATLHPAVQTGVVFAVVVALAAMIPNSLVEGVVQASGLSALFPPAAPPIFLEGRVAISLAAGLLVALVFAMVQWMRERRANAAPVRSRIESEDDPLAVRPLAATRELGARFDDSPYLAPPPPTPDARLDPDSTMGDPRWQVPGEDGDEDAGTDDGHVEDAPTLIDRGTGWDREAPEPEEEWEAEPPTTAARPQPGNAAGQWDGEERRRDADADGWAGPERRAHEVEDPDPEPEMSALVEPPTADPQPWHPSPPTSISVEDVEDVKDEALPSTDELLDRLTRAAERRPNPAEAPPVPAAGLGGAAAELARALAALRG